MFPSLDAAETIVSAVPDQPAYAPPAIVVLGSLNELTLGGDDGGEADGWGTSGATGSI